MAFWLSDLCGPSCEDLNNKVKSLEGMLKTKAETNEKLYRRVMKAEGKLIEISKEEKDMAGTDIVDGYFLKKKSGNFRVIESRPNNESDFFVSKSFRQTYEEALELAQKLAVQYPQNTYYVSGVLATVKAEIPVASVAHYQPVAKESVDSNKQG
jgi:hypothetical protein